jgi:hypothetical protein
VEIRRFNDRTHGIVAEFTEVLIYGNAPHRSEDRLRAHGRAGRRIKPT